MDLTKGEFSRLKQTVAFNTGWRMLSDRTSRIQKLAFRRPRLHVFDSYLKNTQYQHLKPWDSDISRTQTDDRSCQPKTVFPLPEIGCKLFASHITPQESRLMFFVDDEKKQQKIDDFIENCMFWPYLDSALPSYFINGSMFIRFRVENKKVLFDHFNTKYCFPEFNDDRTLKSIVIRYIYETDELNSKMDTVWRWFKHEITETHEILYDNPVYETTKDNIPEFNVKKTIRHNLGFVPGEWVKTTFETDADDGDSIIKNSLDALDDFNYLKSKQSSSIYYHLYPMLMFYGFNPDQVDNIFSNAARNPYLKAVNALATEMPAGKGDARFLEAQNSALAYAQAQVDQNLQLLQQATCISLLDPEKIAGYAQSGRAMEALFKPVVQYVKSKRSFLKSAICSIFEKLEVVSNKMKTNFVLPEGCIQEAKKTWGNIFSDTGQDITTRVSYTVQGFTSGIISKKTAIKHLAKDFEIKNVEEELKMVEQEAEQQRENDLLDFKNQNDVQNPPKKDEK